MKTHLMIQFIAVICLLASNSAAFANHEGHPHESSEAAIIKSTKVQNGEIGETITVKATGLVCDFCARAMEKVLMKRPEVAGLSVDLTKKTVTIRVNKGSTLDDDTVTTLVKSSGYGIESIERS